MMNENNPKDDRDHRYKNILYGQLGTNGISLIVTFSFLMVLSLILIMLVSMGFVISQPNNIKFKLPALMIP